MGSNRLDYPANWKFRKIDMKTSANSIKAIGKKF